MPAADVKVFSLYCRNNNTTRYLLSVCHVLLIVAVTSAALPSQCQPVAPLPSRQRQEEEARL
eukprot:scaffold2392_cov166-Ochromonas_danica.AAC.5